jgi:hypothetical protein
MAASARRESWRRATPGRRRRFEWYAQRGWRRRLVLLPGLQAAWRAGLPVVSGPSSEVGLQGPAPVSVTEVSGRGARLPAAGRGPFPRPVLTLLRPVSWRSGSSRTELVGESGAGAPGEGEPSWPSPCSRTRSAPPPPRAPKSVRGGALPRGRGPRTRAPLDGRSDHQRGSARSRAPGGAAGGQVSHGHRGGREPDAWSGGRCSCTRRLRSRPPGRSLGSSSVAPGPRDRVPRPKPLSRPRCPAGHRRLLAHPSAGRGGPPPEGGTPDPTGSWGWPPGGGQRGALPDSSHERFKDRPSVDICCTRPLPVLRRPRPNGVPAEAGIVPAPSRLPKKPGRRRRARLRGAPSVRACQARISFRPCRFSRLRRLPPRAQCRSVAPCSRPWGSPGFQRRPRPRPGPPHPEVEGPWTGSRSPDRHRCKQQSRPGTRRGGLPLPEVGGKRAVAAEAAEAAVRRRPPPWPEPRPWTRRAPAPRCLHPGQPDVRCPPAETGAPRSPDLRIRDASATSRSRLGLPARHFLPRHSHRRVPFGAFPSCAAGLRVTSAPALSPSPPRNGEADLRALLRAGVRCAWTGVTRTAARCSLGLRALPAMVARTTASWATWRARSSVVLGTVHEPVETDPVGVPPRHSPSWGDGCLAWHRPRSMPSVGARLACRDRGPCAPPVAAAGSSTHRTPRVATVRAILTVPEGPARIPCCTRPALSVRPAAVTEVTCAGRGAGGLHSRGPRVHCPVPEGPWPRRGFRGVASPRGVSRRH